MTDVEKLKALNSWCSRQQEWVDCERSCPGSGGPLVALAGDMLGDVRAILTGHCDEHGYPDYKFKVNA